MPRTGRNPPRAGILHPECDRATATPGDGDSRKVHALEGLSSYQKEGPDTMPEPLS